MAFYNASIATQIIDATFNSANFRSEFRITKDGLYLSNMRIHNLGLTIADTEFQLEGAYNFLTGIHGAVENIYLYDGKQVLDQVIHYNDRSAFTEYNRSNQANSDIYKFTSKTGLGFVLNREPQLKPGEAATAQNQALITEFYPNSARDIGKTQDTSPLGFLNLREVFPMLKSVEFLHTGIFKNLRVVIEYKKTANATAYLLENNFNSTSLPILVVDQVMNENLAGKVLSEFKTVTFNAQEMEQVLLPVNIPKQKFRLNAFSNKMLTSLMIQKKAQDITKASKLYKQFGSESVVDEEIQILVDGSNILPQNGVDRPMWRLALLTDSFGNCNAHTGSSSLPPYLPQNIVAGVTKTIGEITADVATFADRCGRLDYFGCIVNKPINTLDIVFTRTIDADMDDRYKQGLFLNVFGNVIKSIVPTPNSKSPYTIQYAGF